MSPSQGGSFFNDGRQDLRPVRHLPFDVGQYDREPMVVEFVIGGDRRDFVPIPFAGQVAGA
jgi:hypothetical protein